MLSLLGTALPARADAAHPTIFTFSAQRTSHDLVSFSGRYATWSEATGAYVAADGGVTIEDRVPGTSKWREITGAETDDAGLFSGTEHIRPARGLRASDVNGAHPSAVSNADAVDYYGPLISTFSSIQAYQPRKSGPVRVYGSSGGWAAFEPQSGEDPGGPLEGMTEYRSPSTHLLVQWKIRGRWRTATKVVTKARHAGSFAVAVKEPKSTTWRVVQSGDAAYTRGKSDVFHTAKKRFTGN